MPKIWKIKEGIPESQRNLLKDYPAITAQMLKNRGILNKEQAEEFLNPKYERLVSPYLGICKKRRIGFGKP